MIYISSINNCEINLTTSECWAYFSGYMVEMILEILKDHFKDKKGINNV